MPRILDDNGFITMPDNPISKVGVFDYLGREIGAPDPNRIYRVYRPAEELSRPETIESFKLAPFINDHEMLGIHGVPVEKKGMQGVIGEQVYFDAPYLRGNIRIHSTAAQALVNNGKIDLSPGYRCRYEFTPGVFDGEQYDAIQRDIRGNHLALVDEGRTGPDVSVQDKSFDGRFLITLDSKEVLAMLPQTLEELIALIEAAVAKALAGAKPDATDEADPNAPPKDPAAKDEDTDNAEIDAAGATREVEKAAAEGDVAGVAEAVAKAAEAAAEAAKSPEATAVVDALMPSIKALTTLVKSQDAAIKQLRVATDSGTLAANAVATDALYRRVTPLIGNFDQAPASKSVQGIAEYACSKLNLNPVKGRELDTLNGYLAAQDAKPVHTTDSKSVGSGQTVDTAWGAQGSK